MAHALCRYSFTKRAIKWAKNRIKPEYNSMQYMWSHKNKYFQFVA